MSTFSQTLKLRRHKKAVRNLSSRFKLDPSTGTRVAGAQFFVFFFSVFCTCFVGPSFFFFFFRETIRRFSGLLYMKPLLYARTGYILFVFVALSYRAHSPGHTQQNLQRARRYNAAAHKHQQPTPCVCDTPICAVLPWLQ